MEAAARRAASAAARRGPGGDLDGACSLLLAALAAEWRARGAAAAARAARICRARWLRAWLPQTATGLRGAARAAAGDLVAPREGHQPADTRELDAACLLLLAAAQSELARGAAFGSLGAAADAGRPADVGRALARAAGACPAPGLRESLFALAAAWLHAAAAGPRRARAAACALVELVAADGSAAAAAARLALQGAAMPARSLAARASRHAHAAVLAQLLRDAPGEVGGVFESTAGREVLREALCEDAALFVRALLPALAAGCSPLQAALREAAGRGSPAAACVAGALLEASEGADRDNQALCDLQEALVEGDEETAAAAAAAAHDLLTRAGSPLPEDSHARIAAAERSGWAKRVAMLQQGGGRGGLPRAEFLRLAAALGGARARVVPLVTDVERVAAALQAPQGDAFDDGGDPSDSAAAMGGFARRAASVACAVCAAAEGAAVAGASDLTGEAGEVLLTMADCGALLASAARAAARRAARLPGGKQDAEREGVNTAFFSVRLASAILTAGSASGASALARLEAMRSLEASVAGAAEELLVEAAVADGGGANARPTRTLTAIVKASGGVYASASASEDRIAAQEAKERPVCAALEAALDAASPALLSAGVPIPVRSRQLLAPPTEPSASADTNARARGRSARNRKAPSAWWAATPDKGAPEQDKGDSSDDSDSDSDSDSEGEDSSPWKRQRLVAARALLVALEAAEAAEGAHAAKLLGMALPSSSASDGDRSASEAAAAVASRLESDIAEGIDVALMAAHCTLLERCMALSVDEDAAKGGARAARCLGAAAAALERVLASYELPHAPSVRRLLRGVLAGSSRARALAIAADGLVPRGGCRRRGRVGETLAAAARAAEAAGGAADGPLPSLYLAANAGVEATVVDELACFVGAAVGSGELARLMGHEDGGASALDARALDTALRAEAPLLSGVVCALRWRLEQRAQKGGGARRRLPTALATATTECLDACAIFARASSMQYAAAAAGAPPSQRAAAVVSDGEALAAASRSTGGSDVTDAAARFLASRDELLRRYAAGLGGVAAPPRLPKRRPKPKAEAGAGEGERRPQDEGALSEDVADDEDYALEDTDEEDDGAPAEEARSVSKGKSPTNAFIAAALASDGRDGNRADDFSDLADFIVCKRGRDYRKVVQRYAAGWTSEGKKGAATRGEGEGPAADAAPSTSGAKRDRGAEEAVSEESEEELPDESNWREALAERW